MTVIDFSKSYVSIFSKGLNGPSILYPFLWFQSPFPEFIFSKRPFTFMSCNVLLTVQCVCVHVCLCVYVRVYLCVYVCARVCVGVRGVCVVCVRMVNF